MKVTWSGSVRAAAVCLALGGLGLFAEAQPVGHEFRVNTYTTGYEDSPSVAAISDAYYVVVWRESGTSTRDGVFARIVDVNGGPVGAEFRVNTYTSGAKQDPSVGSDLAGNFVVVWTGDGEDGSATGIFGQRFNFLGAPLGGEFRVNTATASFQTFPRVGVQHSFGGGFVVAWQDDSVGGGDVVAQRFASLATSGAPAGAPFRVNTYTTDLQTRASVGVYGGGFVVAWNSNGQDGDGTSTHLQRFTTSGAPVGAEFQLNSYTTGFQDQPRIAVRNDGSFLVVWRDADGFADGIFGRFFDTGGSAGPVFRVNTVTTDSENVPGVGVDADGSFLVVWEGFRNGMGNDIYAQRFGPAGAPEAAELLVNTYTTGHQVVPAVAGGGSGRFLVAWVDWERDKADVYAQALCRVGDANGDGAVNVSDVLFLINHLFAGGPQPNGCVDVNGDGALNVSDVLYLINYLFAGGPPPV